MPLCLVQTDANVGVSVLRKGTQLRSDLKLCGFQSDVAVGANLVSMPATGGSLNDVRIVVSGLREQNALVGGTMNAEYAQLKGT